MIRPLWVAEPYSAAAEAVVRLFYPHVEAVIHDIGQDVVVGIWNPISGRRPGDASLLDPSLLGELAEAASRVPTGRPACRARRSPRSARSSPAAAGCCASTSTGR